MSYLRPHYLRYLLLLGLITTDVSHSSSDDEWMMSEDLGLPGHMVVDDFDLPSNSNWPPRAKSPDLSDFVVADNVVEYSDEVKPAKKVTQKRPVKTKAAESDFDFPAIEGSDEVVTPKKTAATAAKTKASLPPKKTVVKPTAVGAQSKMDAFVQPTKSKKATEPKKKAASLKRTREVVQEAEAAKPIAPKAPLPINDNSPNIVHPEKILQIVDRNNEYFKGKTVAVIDFETTSFSPNIGGRAVSLGILIMKNGRETLRWEAIFNPGKDSNAGAFKAHGISRTVTRTKPYFFEQADEIFSILSNADAVVAHNARFDYRYFLAEYQQATILRAIKKWNLERLTIDRSPLSAQDKDFVKQELVWVNSDPHIQVKRLGMLQNRLATAIWLYLTGLEGLTKNHLYDPLTGRFAVPFLPHDPRAEEGFTKKVNAALHGIYTKLTQLKGRTKTEKDQIKWKTFEKIDISDSPEFTQDDKRRKAVLDKQIMAVGMIKRFTFLEMNWDKVYDWKRVGEEGSVFYNKTDKELLNQIIGFLNLAKALVDNGLYVHSDALPSFLDYDRTWVDTYAMAKGQLKVGKDIEGLKLDHLCDYYGVSRESRKNGHGALIDSDLLAKVYAHMRGTDIREIPANDNAPQRPVAKAVAPVGEFWEDDVDADKLNEKETSEEPEEKAKSNSKKKAADNGLIGGIF